MNAAGSVALGYPCPHCHRRLDFDDDRWRGWVLCPECGLPGLPPPRLPRKRRPRPAAPARAGAAFSPEVHSIQEPTVRGPDEGFPPVRPPARASSPTRLIFTTGLFVSAFLLLIAYLERSTPNTIVFGCLTVVCFLALLRRPRSR